jgi:hypothetical protein
MDKERTQLTEDNGHIPGAHRRERCAAKPSLIWWKEGWEERDLADGLRKIALFGSENISP